MSKTLLKAKTLDAKQTPEPKELGIVAEHGTQATCRTDTTGGCHREILVLDALCLRP